MFPSNLLLSKENRGTLRLALVAGIATVCALLFFSLSSRILSKNTQSLAEGKRLLAVVKTFQDTRRIDFGKAFYASDTPTDFVGEILEWVNRHRLKLVAFKPEERTVHKRPGATFMGYAMALRVKGTFSGVYNFMKDLETKPLFILEDSFILEKVDEDSVELSLRFVLPLAPQEKAP